MWWREISAANGRRRWRSSSDSRRQQRKASNDNARQRGANIRQAAPLERIKKRVAKSPAKKIRQHRVTRRHLGEGQRREKGGVAVNESSSNTSVKRRQAAANRRPSKNNGMACSAKYRKHGDVTGSESKRECIAAVTTTSCCGSGVTKEK